MINFKIPFIYWICLQNMTKHFRACNFCDTSTTNSPKCVIFSASKQLKRACNVPKDSSLFICERHFSGDDLLPHGASKRLRKGCLPHFDFEEIKHQDEISMVSLKKKNI